MLDLTQAGSGTGPEGGSAAADGAPSAGASRGDVGGGDVTGGDVTGGDVTGGDVTGGDVTGAVAIRGDTAAAGVTTAGVAEAGVAEAGVAEAGVAEAGVAEAGVVGAGGPVVGDRRRPGTWSDLGWLLLAQAAVMLPLLAVAAGLGGSHLTQVLTAAACTWPWVLVSYAPMLVPTTSPSVLVQIYLAIMIRLFGTLATVIVVRQIAAPLAPDSWFAYIFAFYLTGLLAESWRMIAGLHRDSVSVRSH